MIKKFFEGPAGSGKTHQLIEFASGVSDDMLGEDGQQLLALTFMNGARHRLTGRFADVPKIRGRFRCQTFDAFAGWLTSRRRSLLRTLAVPDEGALNVFDRTCRDAAVLLETTQVAQWVAGSYPLVVVDEAQDLDAHRLRLLRALSTVTCVAAAADDFQDLSGRAEAAEVMSWLRAAQTVTPLRTNRRTSADGLLRVAGALRAGTNVCAELTVVSKMVTSYVGPGIKIIEAPARSKGALVAWVVADELSRMGSAAAILTPDAQGDVVRTVVGKVSQQPFNRNKKIGLTFGPFPLAWEQREDDEAEALLAKVPGGDVLPLVDAIDGVDRLECAARSYITRRLERARNVRGDRSITRTGLRQVIHDVLRDSRRAAPRSTRGRRVMTIHRAKNREFRDVLVLWPHTVGGSAEYQRRLLYNAVTRAKELCSVVVFGTGRMVKTPFAG